MPPGPGGVPERGAMPRSAGSSLVRPPRRAERVQRPDLVVLPLAQRVPRSSVCIRVLHCVPCS
eukprot:6637465-Prymnesium_polylepis.2